jgi:WD domain, G-beta repeat
MLPQLLRGLAEPQRRGIGLALRNMPASAAPDGSPMQRLVDALVSARVLLIKGDGPDATLQLAHDAVLRGWARAREIAEKEQDFFRIRDDVTTAENRWRGQRRNDLLLASGLPLAEAQSLLAIYGPELGTEVTTFIEASSRKAQARQRRGYALAAVFGFVAIAGVGAGVLAQLQHAEATRQRDISESRKVEAESRKREADRQAKEALNQKQQAQDQRNQALATQSRFLADLARQALRSNDETRAALLALEALPDTGGGSDRPYIGMPELALNAAVQNLREFAILGQQDNLVFDASYSPDGQRILTVSAGEAQLWDGRTMKSVAVIRADGLDSAAFSPDGQQVVTGSGYRTVALTTGSGDEELPGGSRAKLNSSVAFRFSPLVTAAGGGKVRVWNAQNAEHLAVLTGGSDRESNAQFSPDGKHILTASSNNEARIWSLETGMSVVVLRGHTGPIFSAAFSPDGRRVVTASADMTAIVWDWQTGQLISRLSGHKGPALVAKFSPNNRSILLGSAERTARVWDAESGKSVRELTGHQFWVEHVTFDETGRLIATASGDGTAIIWDVNAQKAETVKRRATVSTSAIV